MKKFLVLPEETWKKLEREIKLLLHASRDCLRNQGEDTTKIKFSVYDSYHSEAFGTLRTLKVLGYGDYGIDISIKNDKEKSRTNLGWWFRLLEDQVLKEENFGNSNECDFCLDRWGKDGAGRKR